MVISHKNSIILFKVLRIFRWKRSAFNASGRVDSGANEGCLNRFHKNERITVNSSILSV